MTISQAIAKFDYFRPNTLEYRDKVAWLSQLDTMIKTEIVDTHQDRCGMPFTPYDETTDPEKKLLLNGAYDEMYIYFMEMQTDYMNGDIERYQNSRDMFTMNYKGFANLYNRMHLPLGKEKKYF